jgi:DMSO reductase anchor subunit
MRIVTILYPRKHLYWKWPALFHLICSGIGIGGYIFLNFTLNFLETIDFSDLTTLLLNLFLLALVCLGFVSLTIEAGRPKRTLFMYRGFFSSWISIETFFFMIFFASIILNEFIKSNLFSLIIIFNSSLFLIIQGLIFSSMLGIPNWCTKILPFFILSSGFTSGTGVTLILLTFLGYYFSLLTFFITIAIILVNAFIWIWYLIILNKGLVVGPTNSKKNTLLFIYTYIILFILLFASIFQFDFIAFLHINFINITIGLLILFISSFQKYFIIYKVSFLRDVTLSFYKK